MTPNEDSDAEPGPTAPDTLSYEEVSSEEMGRRAAERFSYSFVPPHDPDEVMLAGSCPRCDGAMLYAHPLIVVRGMAEQRAPDTPEPTEMSITVLCRCDHDHPGAGDEEGCGAAWTITVPRPR